MLVNTLGHKVFGEKKEFKPKQKQKLFLSKQPEELMDKANHHQMGLLYLKRQSGLHHSYFNDFKLCIIKTKTS